jgi:hypothetical protein
MYCGPGRIKAPAGLEFRHMTIDFTAMQPYHVAAVTALVGLVAAVAAGCFGLVQALINAWAAARLSRLTARRVYRVDALKPYSDAVSKELDTVRSVLMDVVRLDEDPYLDARECIRRLDTRARSVRVATVLNYFKSGSKFSRANACLQQKSQAVSDQAAILREHTRNDDSEGPFYFSDVPEEVLEQFTKRLSEFVNASADMRKAIEDFIFN